MALRFTLNDPLVGDVVIEEPVGWDGIYLRFKRDKNWHGYFDFMG